MREDQNSQKSTQKDQSVDWSLFRPYVGWAVVLTVVVLISNGLNLAIPRLIGGAIDSFDPANTDISVVVDDFWLIVVVGGGIFLAAIIQAFLAAWIAERVAKDFRRRLIQKITSQSLEFVNSFESGKLYTMITSDTEAIKNIISLGLVNIFSATIILVGSIILLFSIHARLALIAVISLPLMVLAFGWVFRNISQYFRKSQEVLEKVSRVLEESVMGAMLIRVLAAQQTETQKFEVVNAESREVGYRIVSLFSALLPIINLLSNFTIVAIIWFGGRMVVGESLSIGEFSAFISYVNLLVTPIFILGFVSNVVSRSFVSLKRVSEVLETEDSAITDDGFAEELLGNISFEQVSLELGGKKVLENISFEFEAGKRNAIVGPTAAGKTLLMYLMAGILKPTSGEIRIDGTLIDNWNKLALFEHIGLVFQDSVLFRASLRENIVFDKDVSEEDMKSMLHVSHLDDVVDGLENGLETVVSERGTNLSGGQKQRAMLARALAIQPKVLLLDDFTARVDIKTEQEILSRLEEYYADTTLISISQKLSSVLNFDSIVVLMEGELIGQGTHEELLESSHEYRQIWDSQQ